ncbi:hypothetical protein AAMO2058_001396900 [Amorphochlora amoebiformis]|uniref:Major facilitator superfamily (MFS) profile domain-containing protein n=1 Tax=Amorphochlora amoebiformis TaxID=1561963 RepID=A0A7S0GME2_9EUKA|mmetsp:Transcript_10644/g.16848  ORF Transcript_10644/g.16848 Transcript_10644/m.16848 type:complete len:425 (+) Transcript_10644:31-1305(+)
MRCGLCRVASPLVRSKASRLRIRQRHIPPRTLAPIHRNLFSGESKGGGREEKKAEKGASSRFKAVFGDMDPDIVKQVAILSSAQIMLNLGFSQMVPVMPMFAAKMGGHLGATGVGIILSAPSVATLLLNFPLGRMCDTVGRKPLMWFGTALTSLGTTCTGFVSSMGPLLACRLLVGAGSSASMTGSSAYISDLSDKAPKHRAKLMGIHQALVGSVWIVGPAVGGYLAEAYGYRNSFLIAGICAAVCSLSYTQLPETLNKKPLKASEAAKDVARATTNVSSRGLRDQSRAWLKEVKKILSSKNQQALIALACEHPIRFASFTTAVALHASNAAGSGPGELGMLFTALALSQGFAMPIGAWLADKCPGAKKRMVVPFGLASSLAFASLAFATKHEHFLISMAIQGFCAGFKQPAVTRETHTQHTHR